MESEPRIAIVTGAAQGLGLAIARRLARDGATVVLCDRDHDAAMAAAATFDPPALAIPVDVADESSVGQAMAAVEARFGRLDILVNNAGISGMRAPVAELALDDWEQVLRINLTGSFLMTRAAIPVMTRGGHGRIVMVASQAARGRTGVGKAHYAASKGGMVAFARVLADEVGRDGITVNCVAPSRTMTDLTRANAAHDPAYFAAGIAQTALGRLAEADDTANAVAWLCSAEAGFVTGAILDVTGGAFMP